MPLVISCIIPALNEAENLAQLLPQLLNYPELEIILVDGGSTDSTKAIAQSYPVTLLTTTPGRAKQMNLGASRAQGEILLFLHADTRLPLGFPELICHACQLPGVVAGAFELKIAGDLTGLGWIARLANWRSHWLQLPYGDQALFLSRKNFQAVGGFPELPIMEDFQFVRSLQKLGRIAIIPQAATTSGRRWQKFGLIRTTLLNQIVIAAFYLGVPPDTIAKWYRRGC